MVSLRLNSSSTARREGLVVRLLSLAIAERPEDLCHSPEELSDHRRDIWRKLARAGREVEALHQGAALPEELRLGSLWRETEEAVEVVRHPVAILPDQRLDGIGGSWAEVIGGGVLRSWRRGNSRHHWWRDPRGRSGRCGGASWSGPP